MAAKIRAAETDRQRARGLHAAEWTLAGLFLR